MDLKIHHLKSNYINYSGYINYSSYNNILSLNYLIPELQLLIFEYLGIEYVKFFCEYYPKYKNKVLICKHNYYNYLNKHIEEEIDEFGTQLKITLVNKCSLQFETDNKYCNDIHDSKLYDSIYNDFYKIIHKWFNNVTNYIDEEYSKIGIKKFTQLKLSSFSGCSHNEIYYEGAEFKNLSQENTFHISNDLVQLFERLDEINEFLNICEIWDELREYVKISKQQELTLDDILLNSNIYYNKIILKSASYKKLDFLNTEYSEKEFKKDVKKIYHNDNYYNLSEEKLVSINFINVNLPIVEAYNNLNETEKENFFKRIEFNNNIIVNLSQLDVVFTFLYKILKQIEDFIKLFDDYQMMLYASKTPIKSGKINSIKHTFNKIFNL